MQLKLRSGGEQRHIDALERRILELLDLESAPVVLDGHALGPLGREIMTTKAGRF